MSRRVLAVLALVLASAFIACAEPVTAPQRPTLEPSAPHQSGGVPSTCKGGFILSEGRCG